MAFAIEPLGETMGAAVTGLDLNAALDRRTIDDLNDALAAHVVLCIRDQDFTPPQFAAAARRFGEPVPQINKRFNIPDLPEIGILSSEDKDEIGTGKRVIRGTTWHTDHSFWATPPKATILYALVVPQSGGDTSFCDTRAAYDALPAETRRRIDGLKAVHTYQASRSANRLVALDAAEKKATPDVVHPLVRRHLPTGRNALYLSTTRLERIVGLDRAESDSLIDDLVKHATQPRFRYDHKWRGGDMVIWDNRCSLHHANADYPLDAKRLLHRIILAGETPV